MSFEQVIPARALRQSLKPTVNVSVQAREKRNEVFSFNFNGAFSKEHNILAFNLEYVDILQDIEGLRLKVIFRPNRGAASLKVSNLLAGKNGPSAFAIRVGKGLLNSTIEKSLNRCVDSPASFRYNVTQNRREVHLFIDLPDPLLNQENS